MTKSTTKVTATAEQVGNAAMSAAPLSAALGETGRQEIESSTSAAEKKQELKDMQLGGETKSEADLQNSGVKSEGDLTDDQLQSATTGISIDTSVKPIEASAVHTGVSTIFTEVHSATFQNLNHNVKAALAAAGDQASPLLKSVGEFLSNINPIQADYVQGELATMSVTIPQADPYIMQAFRELFNISGKEAALRIQMMNRAMKRAEELSKNRPM